jgi:hypothetical protein
MFRQSAIIRTFRYLNAAKAFKLNCRQSELLDDHHASDTQANDACSALRSGLSSSKKAVFLTERVPSSLLPYAVDTVQSAASSMAASLAARHSSSLAGSGATVVFCAPERACRARTDLFRHR